MASRLRRCARMLLPRRAPGPMAPPKTEEEMRSFMADYERRLALEERPLRISNVGAWLGFMVSGGLLYLLYCVDDVSSTLSELWAYALGQMSEESRRRVILRAARWRVLPKDLDKDDPYLVVEPLEGLKFFTPVGLASGLDCEGEGIEAFFNLGFGFVEVGPVRECKALAQKLSGRDSSGQIGQFGLLGALIMGSKEELLNQLALLGPHMHYLVLEAPKADFKLLRELALAALKVQGSPKIFLRVPASWPDASMSHADRLVAVGALAEVVRSSEAAGLVICHDDACHGCQGTVESRRAHRQAIAAAYRGSKGDVVLIASGGVRHGRDALDAVQAGATAVQISELLLTEGPRACRRIKDGVAQLLMQEGHVNLESVIGSSLQEKKSKKKRNPWRPNAPGLS